LEIVPDITLIASGHSLIFVLIASAYSLTFPNRYVFSVIVFPNSNDYQGR